MLHRRAGVIGVQTFLPGNIFKCATVRVIVLRKNRKRRQSVIVTDIEKNQFLFIVLL